MSKDLYSVTTNMERREQNRIRNEKINEEINNPDNYAGLRWGLIAGLIMAAFLVSLELLGAKGNIGIKFMKYLFLAGITWYVLSSQKSRMGSSYRFSDGMRLGSILTFTSALTLGIMNMLLYAWTGTLAFDKYALSAGNIGEVTVISVMLFFEVLVFGLITTFIGLQYLKPKRNKIR
ncbi:MAG: hypothetical protein AB8F74_08715 [Saprospiraceae bacterium]